MRNDEAARAHDQSASAALFATLRVGDASGRVAVLSREGAFYVLALLVLLFATRPYVGLLQDANLYAALALDRLDDIDLSADLFMRYGNQGQFSFFTTIYAVAIGAIGLVAANISLWVLGLLLWLTGLVVLARSFFDGQRKAFLAAALVLVLDAGYGNTLLGYGENFVTPRVFAEAFSMIALALVWRHSLWALAFFFAAAVLHPLIALPAMMIAGFILTGSVWRLILLGVVGLGIAAVLGWAGIVPFTWLFQQFDPEWHRVTVMRDAIVFPTGWNALLVFAGQMLPAVSLFTVSLDGDRRLSRLAAGLLVLVVPVLMVSVIGSDIFMNRLITSLQIWRVLLFMTLLGTLFLVVALTSLRLHRRSWLLLIISAVFSAIETTFGMVNFGSAAVALGALISVVFERWLQPPLSVWQRALVLLPVVWGGGLAVSIIVALVLSGGASPPVAEPLVRLLCMALAMAILLLPIISPRRQIGACAGLCVGLWVTISIVDDRDSMQGFIASDTPIAAKVASLLDGRTAYWENSLPLQWFKLNMPAYYGCRQKSGTIFFREQALEFERRANVLRALNTTDFAETSEGGCPVKANPEQTGPQDRQQLIKVCSQLPELEYLILSARPQFSASFVMEFQVPVSQEGRASLGRYRAYDCAHFRG